MQRKSFLAKAVVLIGLSLAAKPALADNKPWQLNLSIAPTKGLLTLGRDFGNRYLGVGLHGISYSQRSGFEVNPALSYQHRFTNPYLPYLGLSAALAYSAKDNNFHDPIATPALGYEWRFRHIYLHAEVFASTPMDSRLGKTWAPSLGGGLGLPF